ncbi:hypothetical protein PHYBOEH_006002 [Phytophthora boehmeriae]|uniref:Uncharacterized protein n=1 Tax=Phytophthora boehmeriae TaxID=109152 RepID=A0A8T1WQ28_9STRA|nr:hypothetical protein PHYBOEH_006002 [Phytophthora boehmeriae]
MLSRSFEEEAEAPRWLLFVRQEEQEDADTCIVCTAVVTTSVHENGDDARPRNVVAELRVDDTTLEKHIDEMGIEEEVSTFWELVVETLEERRNVKLVVEKQSDEAIKVLLELHYTLGETSRKGVFELPLVATNVAQSVVNLLKSVHDAPPQPVISKEQRMKRAVKKRTLSGAVKDGGANAARTTASQESGTGSTSQSSDNGPAPPAINPSVFKRRHMPTGTTRRKGPRGAKLAKS